MNRRDLLKYFGAGAVVAPAVGAGPLARLIEAPKIELALPHVVVTPINLKEVNGATVILEMADGSRREISGTQVAIRGGFIDPSSLVRIEFLSENKTSPAYFAVAGSIELACTALVGDRCPYCRSKLHGDRCLSCGASA
jgi:hypothetical protein